MRRHVFLLVLAVALVASCGDDDAATDGPGDTDAPGAGASVEVMMESISYRPVELTVEAGTTVTWIHQDGSVAHTTTADDGTWDSGTMSEGDEFSFTFDEPGTYPYRCSIHPAQMTGTIIVTESGAGGGMTESPPTTAGSDPVGS